MKRQAVAGNRVFVWTPEREAIGRGTVHDIVSAYVILSADGKTYNSAPDPEEYPPEHLVPFDRERVHHIKGVPKIVLDDAPGLFIYGTQVYWEFLKPEDDDPLRRQEVEAAERL